MREKPVICEEKADDFQFTRKVYSSKKIAREVILSSGGSGNDISVEDCVVIEPDEEEEREKMINELFDEVKSIRSSSTTSPCFQHVEDLLIYYGIRATASADGNERQMITCSEEEAMSLSDLKLLGTVPMVTKALRDGNCSDSESTKIDAVRDIILGEIAASMSIESKLNDRKRLVEKREEEESRAYIDSLLMDSNELLSQDALDMDSFFRSDCGLGRVM